MIAKLYFNKAYETLSMMEFLSDWEKLANIATVFGALTGTVGGIFALLAYRNSLRTRRAEWLGKLQQQFFESEKYEKIRFILDYRIEPQFSQLKDVINDGSSYHELLPEFWRYLNFLEFIATLYNVGELTKTELSGLFEYDLRLIESIDFIFNLVNSKETLVYELPILLRKLRIDRDIYL